MRGSVVKRLFLVGLIVCLALLVFLFARRSVVDQMALENEYPRKNMTLTLRREDGGVIRVDGEGKLYADDMKALLKAAGISSRRVEDIIVGDGITEIGYGVFMRQGNLKTLKLGRSVAQARPGALKSCDSLEWLYLPSGLRDIGAGFLYDCEKCRVVTDAQPGDVPGLDNLQEDGRVFAGVDSFETLQARVEDADSLPDALALWW